MGIDHLAGAKSWLLTTSRSAYALGVDGEGNLQHLYWGEKLPRLEDYPLPALPAPYSFESPQGLANLEYPGWGGLIFAEPCLKALYADFTRDVVLKYEGFQVFEAGEVAGALRPAELVVQLRDEPYRLAVDLHYRVYEEENLIERFAVVENQGEQAVQLEIVHSAAWYVPRAASYRLSYLVGKWAGETQLTRAQVVVGKILLESRRGSTSHQANPWFALDPGDSEEERGPVWFGALGWSGNWKFCVEQTPYGQVRVTGGVNDFDFSWRLEPGESFRTPPFYGGYSGAGFGAASRALHRFQRNRLLPRPAAGRPRPVLYNSWEATAFEVSEAGQIALAEKAAAIGVELFVLDDGWFGARSSDRAGLGDWTVNQQKFPRGLQPLIHKVNELGMDFGLWVEPEMVNPASDLYRSHPEWVYRFPARPGTLSRNQLVLNLAIDEVREYLFASLSRLLEENRIAYLKWDHNRHFSEPGWPGGPPQRQREIWVRHVLGFYELVERLRSRFPQTIFESCSGGGGRVDLGVLQRMDQCWPSDNTDALDRLGIHHGYSQVYCARTMVAWVTDSPNFATRRALPLEFRFHSAMTGVLGIGGNLNRWSEEELQVARRLVTLYKQIRPLVQDGDQYRLAEPGQADFSAVQYLAPDASAAVVFAFLRTEGPASGEARIFPRGLSPERLYRLSTSGRARRGAALMKQGIRLRLSGGFRSQVILLRWAERPSAFEGNAPR